MINDITTKVHIAVPATDEILVEFANYYSDSSWFYLWLASFVFKYSKKMSILFYIIYLVIFIISVNVRIIKENVNHDSSCKPINKNDYLLLNKVNGMALGVGILNIVIVFGFSSYMNITHIFSPSQIVKFIIYLVLKQWFIFSLNKFTMDRLVNTHCALNPFCSGSELTYIKEYIEKEENINNYINKDAVLYNDINTGGILAKNNAFVGAVNNKYLYTRLFDTEVSILLFIIGVYLLDTFINANHFTSVVKDKKLYSYAKAYFQNDPFKWWILSTNLLYIIPVEKVSNPRIWISFVFYTLIYFIKFPILFIFYYFNIRKINEFYVKYTCNSTLSTFQNFLCVFPVLILMSNYLPEYNYDYEFENYNPFEWDLIARRFNELYDLNDNYIIKKLINLCKFMVVGLWDIKVEDRWDIKLVYISIKSLFTIGSFGIIYLLLFIIIGLIVKKETNNDDTNGLNNVVNYIIKNNSSNKEAYIIIIIVFILLLIFWSIHPITAIIVSTSVISNKLKKTFKQDIIPFIKLYSFRLSVIVAPILFFILYILTRQYIIANKCFNTTMCIGDNLNNENRNKRLTGHPHVNNKNPNTIFKEQNGQNKDFIEIMFYIMVFLLFAQLVAINFDLKVGVILMNILILCFILLKYVFSNKGSHVLKGISLTYNDVSVLEIVIGCLFCIMHLWSYIIDELDSISIVEF